MHQRRRRRGVAIEQAAAALAVAVIFATSGVLWFTQYSQPSGRLAFSFQGASAVYSQLTGQTNLTAVLLNSGTLPIKLGGINGVPPPPGTHLVNGTFNSYFYSKNGTLIPHGGGGPPDTSYDGWIRVTYLVTGATVGEVLTLTSSFDLYGQLASDSIQVTVVNSIPTNSTTTTSTSTSSATTSSSTTTQSTTSVSSTSSTTSSSATTTTTSTTTGASTTSTSTSITTIATTSSTTTSPSGTISFTIVSATGVYLSNGFVNITVTVRNTGTVPLNPFPMRTPPTGTTVSGKVYLYFFAANGTQIYPCACGTPPDTSNGGWITVTYVVQANVGILHVGDQLTVTYTFRTPDGTTAGPKSYTFTIT